MQNSPQQHRRERERSPLSLVGLASKQCHEWIEEMKRIALGAFPNTACTLHPGQWVRFIGDPHAVKGRLRGIPQLGSYGQVWRRVSGSNHAVYVVFLGAPRLFRLSTAELEPLVGRPVGRPRDHLRRVSRQIRRHAQATHIAPGAPQ